MTDALAQTIANLLGDLARDTGDNRKALVLLERQLREQGEALLRIERLLTERAPLVELPVKGVVS